MSCPWRHTGWRLVCPLALAPRRWSCAAWAWFPSDLLRPLVSSVNYLPADGAFGIGVRESVVRVLLGKLAFDVLVFAGAVQVLPEVVTEEQRVLLREAASPAHVNMGPGLAWRLPEVAFREFGIVPAIDVSQAFERYPERVDRLKTPD